MAQKSIVPRGIKQVRRHTVKTKYVGFIKRFIYKKNRKDFKNYVNVYLKNDFGFGFDYYDFDYYDKNFVNYW